MTTSDKIDLLAIESKLQNIEANARLLHLRVREVINKKTIEKNDIEEIQQIADLLTDYFLDTDQLIVDTLKLKDND